MVKIRDYIIMMREVMIDEGKLRDFDKG